MNIKCPKCGYVLGINVLKDINEHFCPIRRCGCVFIYLKGSYYIKQY